MSLSHVMPYFIKILDTFIEFLIFYLWAGSVIAGVWAAEDFSKTTACQLAQISDTKRIGTLY